MTVLGEHGVVAPEKARSQSERDEPNRSTIAALLREYRRAAGLSQAELAERANMSTGAIGSLEQGLRKAPYRSTLENLAAALDLSGDERERLYRVALHSRGRRSGTPTQTSIESNLPFATTTFIERDEVHRIQSLAERHRCVTVVGPGGIGKTRTTVEAADRLARAQGRDAYFVDLSPLNDESRLLDEICAIVGGDADGLASRNVLLIFDNCEHIIAGVARVVADVLAGCPSISVLATSRERLGISGETLFRLPALRLPEDNVTTADIALTYPAIALFLQRARHAGARLALDSQQVRAVVEICGKLDGVPLAIELAAARVPTMGLVTLRDRLRDALAMPGSVDLAPRHRTLEKTIAWSFDLLSPQEQSILTSLSAFSGSFVLAGAEAVCSDEHVARHTILSLLTRLVEKSLVNVVLSSDRALYSLLESIRAFGEDRLHERRGYGDVALRHALWYAEQADTFRQLANKEKSEFATEIENFRSAIEWCLASGTQINIQVAARIAVGAARIWGIRGRRTALRRYLTDIIERLEDEEPNYELIGRLWKARVDTFDHWNRELIDEATPFLERAGNDAAIAMLNAQLAASQARSGAFALATASHTRAAAYFDADPARRKGNVYHYIVDVGAWIAFSQGYLLEARTALAAVLSAMDEDGADVEHRGSTLQLLAEVEDAAGNSRTAIDLARASLDVFGTTGDSKNVAITMSNLCGYLLRNGGDLGEAEAYGEQALRALAAAQAQSSHWDTLLAAQNLAAIIAQRGRSHVAVVILGFIEADFQRTTHKLSQTDQASYDLLVASTQLSLTDENLKRLRADGARLSFDEAIDTLLLALRNG